MLTNDTTRALTWRHAAVALLVLDVGLMAALPFFCAWGLFRVWMVAAVSPFAVTWATGFWTSRAAGCFKVTLAALVPLSAGGIALGSLAGPGALPDAVLGVSIVLLSTSLVVLLVMAGHGWARYFRKPTPPYGLLPPRDSRPSRA